MSSIIKEYVIGTDDFKQPEEYVGKKAVGLLIERLLLLEPGTDPLRPEMGVGLVSKYRYMFPDKLNELKNNVADQLERFLFPYQTVNLKFSVDDHELTIDITVDDNTYKYVTAEQKDNNTVTLKQLRGAE